jgi:hypothetical protein
MAETCVCEHCHLPSLVVRSVCHPVYVTQCMSPSVCHPYPIRWLRPRGEEVLLWIGTLPSLKPASSEGPPLTVRGEGNHYYIKRSSGRFHASGWDDFYNLAQLVEVQALEGRQSVRVVTPVRYGHRCGVLFTPGDWLPLVLAWLRLHPACGCRQGDGFHCAMHGRNRGYFYTLPTAWHQGRCPRRTARSHISPRTSRTWAMSFCICAIRAWVLGKATSSRRRAITSRARCCS